MRTVWAVAITAMVVVAAEAHADTVYLKDGQSIWGTEVVEEGDVLMIVRPGETLRIPARDVNRVERSRVSIPRYYEAPAPASASSGTGPSPTPPAAAPVASGTPPTGGAPSGREAGTVRPPAIQPPVVSGPAQPTPTLPPPPPGADRPR
jgi:hypothetical protein